MYSQDGRHTQKPHFETHLGFSASPTLLPATRPAPRSRGHCYTRLAAGHTRHAAKRVEPPGSGSPEPA